MAHKSHSKTKSVILGSASLITLLGALCAPQVASAQTAKPDDSVVVVTGFRASLQSAVTAKKKENAIVDVIKAEDIGKFPDNNLSEALQRIPGVSIDRDGGEGRTITVRGLGPGFTRIRLNGMEALATTGGRDSSGGANRDRGFDFNVFAAELFSSITVRKTPSAEIEEGSLGTTVDLQTGRPFDYKGFALAGAVQGQYNDLSEQKNHRETFLISNRWADGKLGALLSVAYSTNDKFEEGPSTTRWENGSTAAGTSANRFHGYIPTGSSTLTLIPVATSTAATGNGGTLSDLSGDALAITKALHPRIPRYGHIIYDQSRLGITAAFQMKPTPDTLISLDLMHSDFIANRNEQYLEVISFSRSGQGTPRTDVYNYSINPAGELYKASFNNVDVRSENRHDELQSIFDQVNLTWDQNFGDKLKFKAFLGASKSMQKNPEQTTLTLDSYDVQGYSYDYSTPNAPVFNYGTVSGCTVAQACYWNISNSTAKGDASLVRVRPNATENTFVTSRLDGSYAWTPSLTLKAGVEAKRFVFSTTEARRGATDGENIPLAAATLLNANLGDYVSLQSLADGSQSWLIPDFGKIKAAIGFDCQCINAYGNYTVITTGGARGNNQDATEKDTAAYVQLDFQHDVLGVPVRGNLGVRYVTTDQSSTGFVTVPVTEDPMGVAYKTFTRSYKDTLPSFNITAEPLRNVLVRFSASKVMSRPLLSTITPGNSINFTGRSATIGNPYIDPVRSTDYDLNLEWYRTKDSLFSAGLFYKDMGTFIQSYNRTADYSTLGFDASLGTPFGIVATTPFTVAQPVNTPGGIVRGYEINLQQAFTFLPAPFDKFGALFNYTHVSGQVAYYITATQTATANVPNLSPDAYNATLYYETDRYSARITAARRSRYISVFKPGNNADFQGKNATLNIDAQATYTINKHLTLTLQGLNLTDQYDDRYNEYNSAQFGNVDGNAPLDYVHTGSSYLIGLRYKY